jgi:hypothetical protein
LLALKGHLFGNRAPPTLTRVDLPWLLVLVPTLPLLLPPRAHRQPLHPRR